MLASTVEYLLTKHKCVIVPGLGTFLLQEFSAEMRSNGLIVPPSMKVIFNPELQHSDGLIICYWKQMLTISEAEAEYRLNGIVNELFCKIEAKGSVQFGILGSISITAEGIFVFDNSKQTYRSSSYIGLQSIRIPLLQCEKESITIILSKNKTINSKFKGEDFVRVQINFRPKRLLRKTASWAAAVLLFCFSLPFGSDNYTSTQKAALGLPYLFQKSQIELDQETALTNLPETTIKNVESTAKTLITIEVTKRFYIIVSSCPTVLAAQKELKEWEVNYPQAGVVEKNGRGRIYAQVYTERSIAERMLEKIRKNEKSDAWLYIKAE